MTFPVQFVDVPSSTLPPFTFKVAFFVISTVTSFDMAPCETSIVEEDIPSPTFTLPPVIRSLALFKSNPLPVTVVIPPSCFNVPVLFIPLTARFPSDMWIVPPQVSSESIVTFPPEISIVPLLFNVTVDSDVIVPLDTLSFVEVVPLPTFKIPPSI